MAETKCFVSAGTKQKQAFIEDVRGDSRRPANIST